MANKKSAIKRARQTTHRRARNLSVRTGVKSSRKKLVSALQSGDEAGVRAAYSEFTSKLDKAAKRGIVHKNAADRQKSRVNGLLSARSAA